MMKLSPLCTTDFQSVDRRDGREVRRTSRFRYIELALLLLALCGCGQASSPMTGTAGQVLLNGFGFGDIQVNVFGDADERLAFGVSDSTGSFRLLTPDASRAVHLEPGKYRLTVESVGAVPVPIPAPLAQPDKTPLVREWSGSAEALRVELDVPMK